MNRQSTTERIVDLSRLLIPAQAEPGEYVLQIIVNDDTLGEKRRSTSQWIDFEVVK